MKPRIFQCCTLIILIACCSNFAGFAQEGKTKSDPKVVVAEKALDKFAKAVGSKEDIAKIKTRVMKGHVLLNGKKYGKVMKYQLAPNKMHVHYILPKDKYFQLTTDGKHVWRVDSVKRKPELIDPLNEEAIDTFRKATIDANVNWRKYLKRWTLKGQEEVKGKTLHKDGKTADHLELEGKAKFAPILHHYFDQKTGLLIKTKQQLPEEGLYVWTETFLDDYKKVDGILIPHRISVQIKGVPIDVVIEEVKHNVKVPEQYFRLPASLKSETE